MRTPTAGARPARSDIHKTARETGKTLNDFPRNAHFVKPLMDDDLAYAETVDCPWCGRKAGQRCYGNNGTQRPGERDAHLPRVRLGRRYRELRAQQTRGPKKGPGG